MEIVCPKHKCKSKNIDYDTFDFYHNCVCLDCDYHFLVSYRPEEGCCNSPFLIDVIHRFDFKKTFIYEQCIHCGWTQKRTPKKIALANIRGEYEKGRNDEWYERQKLECSNLYEPIQKLNNFWIKYNFYLASDKWKNIRLKIFERDSNICQMCKIKPAEQVHHLTYENVFKEKLEDLVAVCSECHEQHHDKPKPTEKL